MKSKKFKSIITEAVISFLNEGNLNKVDSVNIPTNVDGAEDPVGDIGLHDENELTEEEKWFKKLAKRVKYKK